MVGSVSGSIVFKMDAKSINITHVIVILKTFIRATLVSIFRLLNVAL
jgi:hypothetical protein